MNKHSIIDARITDVDARRQQPVNKCDVACLMATYRYYFSRRHFGLVCVIEILL